jgi:hypothetical protein
LAAHSSSAQSHFTVATAPCRVFSFSPRPQDSTFEFEKRRNKPVRYDRDLMGTTIRAIKRVGEIQAARQERFYKNRMVARKAMEKAQHRAGLTVWVMGEATHRGGLPHAQGAAPAVAGTERNGVEHWWPAAMVHPGLSLWH